MGEIRATGRRLAGLGMAAAAALALAGITAIPAAAQGHILGAGSPDAIDGSYIVVYRNGASAQTNALAARHNAKITHTFSTALRGFAGTMSEAQARRLAADPAVAFVEQNQVVRALGTQSPTPSWGLDRIDQRDLPLNNSYTYPDNTGAGVRAYIVDTGILTTHTDFGGRAVHGRDTVDNDNDATDCNGHGTHVAGTVGGSAYGVAKGVTLIAVRVLNCQGSGTLAGVAAGVDWVTQHNTGTAVANMSLGASGSNATLETAVRNSIADGVTYGIAAGNGDIFGNPQNACNFTPARVAEAITVGATQNNDAKASFSNFGTCLDIFAPGVGITSAWHTSNTATNTISGTSMATPHVVGAAALQLAANPGSTPQQVRDALVGNATPNKVTNPGTGSPNLLLFVGGGGGTPGSPSVTTGNQSGTVGTAVSVQLAATGGTTPYTWSATGLPPGLSSNSAGHITGTPTTAGTFNSNVTVTDSGGRTGGKTIVWTITGGGGGNCTTATNPNNVNIPDAGAAVSSTVTFSGCSGNASSTTRVAVDIKHTYRGDLVIDLVAPDGTAYRLKNSSFFDSADNVITTYTVNASSELKNGTWRLRVRDVYRADTGFIDSFGLTF
jgi:hypothetical protein